ALEGTSIAPPEYRPLRGLAGALRSSPTTAPNFNCPLPALCPPDWSLDFAGMRQPLGLFTPAFAADPVRIQKRSVGRHVGRAGSAANAGRCRRFPITCHH